MVEIWKPVIGFEELYEVSNLGNVKSLPRKRCKGKVLIPHINKGYEYVHLCTNGNTSYVKVHRIVAMAFLQSIPNKTHVNHIDGNKLNNSVYNLEIVSQSSNIKHSLQILRHGRIKLFDSDKDSIANLLSKNVKISRIAELYGVHKSTMGKFIKRNNLNIEIISSQDL